MTSLEQLLTSLTQAPTSWRVRSYLFFRYTCDFLLKRIPISSRGFGGCGPTNDPEACYGLNNAYWVVAIVGALVMIFGLVIILATLQVIIWPYFLSGITNRAFYWIFTGLVVLGLNGTLGFAIGLLMMLYGLVLALLYRQEVISYYAAGRTTTTTTTTTVHR
eukprot:TRINITY_DN841_c0_g1_i3.p1 TRINITY_DN841_c0_g1~~TRINITY_DN841_c0_g1_i3.p1  ORF type:complete len:162 (-),score=17.06 TRINITY_DN841_c0_g1_i3:21-506(-)